MIIKPKQHHYTRKEKPFGGLVRDIRKRSSFYVSDFSDGYTINTIIKTLVIFTSQLGPALIFGVLLSKYSNHNMGTIETLLGSAITYILWGLIGGQPMILMGLTGPIAIFVGVVYDWAIRLKLPFFVLYEWTGIWTSLLLLLIIAFNKAMIFSPITSFTKNVFSSLTSVLFIVEVFKYISKNLLTSSSTLGISETNQTEGLFSVVVICITVVVMQIFRNIKNTTFLVQWLRIGIRLGSQLLTVLVVTFIIHKTFPSFSYTTISLPNTTSLDPSYIERSWFVNPFRYESVLAINDWYTPSNETVTMCPYSSTPLSEGYCIFPWWAILGSIIPAVFFTISK